MIMKNQYNHKQDKVYGRTIPELQGTWRYPLINNLKSGAIILEPIVSPTIGQNYKRKHNKFGYIDAPQFEVSDENLFDANHFSGIDYHEYGQRLEYGINTAIVKDSIALSAFGGKDVYQHNIDKKNNNTNVGRIGLGVGDIWNISYRFRKDKKLSPIRDEVSTNFQVGKLKLRGNIISLYDIKKYYYYNLSDFTVTKNSIKQANTGISYSLTDNLTVGSDAMLDLEKRSLLYRSIQVTYLKDCVSITAQISDTYTIDGSRNIKKIRGQSFSIRLKALNM